MHLHSESTTRRGPRVATAIDGMVELANNGMLERAHAQGQVRGFTIGFVAACAVIGVAGALVLVGRWLAW